MTKAARNKHGDDRREAASQRVKNGVTNARRRKRLLFSFRRLRIEILVDGRLMLDATDLANFVVHMGDRGANDDLILLSRVLLPQKHQVPREPHHGQRAPDRQG